MERADEIVLRDMMKTIFLYGIIVQIICLIVPGNRLQYSIGLWIGIVVGMGMLVHMRNSLNEALDLGEDGARKYMQKSYAVRYVTVIIIFLVVSYLQIANVVTLLIGIMGLKLSAYLQPIMHSIFQRIKK